MFLSFGELIELVRVRFGFPDDFFTAELNGTLGYFDASLEFLNFPQRVAVLGFRDRPGTCTEKAEASPPSATNAN
jgi:hypothetical protein